ncbi:peptide-methionine (S)-S-oxide reductase MsrA [Marixanthomonas sp. SCSIO 43207]|uniref:peptide-methionine (S)-S-oxide reductase MsrA n=1 Tax=Marixanthomonas sp. SCSIO 43207 TaxID=2779360 RepID=UPI001CA83ED2|nr:peptide-methionine (S)-S-oxide reductase MsrA [Marixanthomonas sp. SCSIO 43207]UAB81393.1 peptide-methionine (S)-S-oxide reductase MsrA [Marixanthomonas sp. SCSIO 43207]
MNKLFFLLFSSLIVSLPVSCQSNDKNKEAEAVAQKTQQPVTVPSENGLERAYFASGCFWCVEAIYESVKGVDEAISGYSGGHTKNPTYESSNTGTTGHAEAVEIIYNPNVVSFKTLVDVYFGSQNITQVNGQGPDRGSQYRSIIFYQNDEQKQIIDTKIAALEKEVGKGNVAAQVLPFQKFWKAEAYHQDYEKNNPNNPYIQNVSIPRLNKFKAKFPDILKTDKETH